MLEDPISGKLAVRTPVNINQIKKAFLREETLQSLGISLPVVMVPEARPNPPSIEPERSDNRTQNNAQAAFKNVFPRVILHRLAVKPAAPVSVNPDGTVKNSHYVLRSNRQRIEPPQVSDGNTEVNEAEAFDDEYLATKISRKMVKRDGRTWYFVHWARGQKGQCYKPTWEPAECCNEALVRSWTDWHADHVKRARPRKHKRKTISQ